MRFESFRINNYKSYSDSGELSLDPGFTIVVGQNDAGKTSLLEALSGKFSSHCHRSLTAQPRRNSPLDPLSWISATVLLSKEEIYDAARKARGLAVPVGRLEDLL